MIVNIERFYEEYFENLAIRLSDISHQPNVKGAERFWINHDIESMSEIESAMSNRLTFPCVVINQLEHDDTASVNLTLETVKGAFAVFYLHDQGAPESSAKSHRAMKHQALLVAKKIKNYIIADLLPTPINLANRYSLHSQKIKMIGGFANGFTPILGRKASGYFYEFTWQIEGDRCHGLNNFSPEFR
jgi:hypothetical protein